MPDETPFLILLVGIVIVMVVFAFKVDDGEDKPVGTAQHGPIEEATVCE